MFDLVPQKMVDRQYSGADPLGKKSVPDAIAATEKLLGTRGRLLGRKLDAEPLIRVMAQAENNNLMREAADGVGAALDKD